MPPQAKDRTVARSHDAEGITICAADDGLDARNGRFEFTGQARQVAALGVGVSGQDDGHASAQAVHDFMVLEFAGEVHLAEFLMGQGNQRCTCASADADAFDLFGSGPAAGSGNEDMLDIQELAHAFGKSVDGGSAIKHQATSGPHCSLRLGD